MTSRHLVVTHITSAPAPPRHAFWVAWLLTALVWSQSHAAALVFEPPAGVVASPRPVGAQSADLNGDGRPDLLVANSNATSISVFLANGAGGYNVRNDFAVDGNPRTLALADYDLDGTLDLAVSLPSWNYVNILLGDGHGSFTLGTRPYTHSYTTDVAWANLNNAGVLDLVVAEDEHDGLDLLVEGTSFSSHVSTGSQPRSILPADLNGDGRTDLAVVNAGAATLSLLIAAPTGGFPTKVDYGTLPGPQMGLMADVDHDGDLDIAVVSPSSNAVSLFRNVGGGSYTSRVSFETGLSPKGLAIADVNGDTHPDIVTANSGASSASILFGDGAGGFESRMDVVMLGTPTSVVVCDLDGDSRQDIICTDTDNDRIVIALQSQQISSVEVHLAADQVATTFGQAVHLLASILPPDSTGHVFFLDRTNSLGERAINSGSAMLSVDTLATGSHRLWARFVETGGVHSRSSDSLTVVVAKEPLTVGLLVPMEPVISILPTTFRAVVSRTNAGTALSQGLVQFMLDGHAIGAAVPTLDGQAESASFAGLIPGSHTVAARFSPADSASFIGGMSSEVPFVVTAASPVISKVRDVPSDQGGRVYVTWRCPADRPGAFEITGYRVWRRVPDLNKAASAGDTFWEAIAELPAAQLLTYGYTAPTPQDSVPGSNPFTAFFIQALTADARVHFASAPDSGYSVDNLSPPAPSPFVARYEGTDVALHWLPSRVADFAEFRLYRGGSINFLPSPSNLIFAGRDTGLVDRAGLGGFYKLAAVDVHGNIGRFAMVSPTSPTATLASFVSSDWTGSSASLVWYGAGLTGLRANVYRSDDGTSWNVLGQVTADEEGFVRFSDATALPRHRYSYKLGILDEDTEQFAGITTIEIPGGHLAIRSVVGNPVRGDAIHFVASLAGTSTARARVLDLAGRVVREQNLQADLSGQLSLPLSGGERLRPGVYLLEVQQAGERAVTRFVYLR